MASSIHVNGNEYCAVTGALLHLMVYVENHWLDGYRDSKGNLFGSYMWDDYNACASVLMRNGFTPKILKLRVIGAEVKPNGEA